tara:strand:+ start:873 stop:1202 length:330 start_codon:yes stop_codon:yes gene_type:complete
MNNTIFNHEISQQIQQERIDVLNETIDIMNRIIKSDEEQINILKHNIDNTKRNRNHIDAIIINKDYQIHQKVLHIESLQHTIKIDKITIKTQEKTIKLYIDNLNIKSNE